MTGVRQEEIRQQLIGFYRSYQNDGEPIAEQALSPGYGDQGDRNFHTSLKHTIDTIYSLENRYL